MLNPAATIRIASDKSGSFWVGFGENFGPYAEHGSAMAYALECVAQLQAKGIDAKISDESAWEKSRG